MTVLEQHRRDLIAQKLKGASAQKIELLRYVLLHGSVTLIAASQVDGPEAIRKADLETKYLEIRKLDGPVQEANARAADEAAHAAKVSEREKAVSDSEEAGLLVYRQNGMVHNNVPQVVINPDFVEALVFHLLEEPAAAV